MTNIFIYIVCFLVFIFLQALAINGIHECFKGACTNDISAGKKCSGNIFYKLNPSFFEKYKNAWWSMPLWSCPKCMASVWGSITYWGTVLPIFKFNAFELWVWIWDLFILVTLNWIIYKKT